MTIRCLVMVIHPHRQVQTWKWKWGLYDPLSTPAVLKRGTKLADWFCHPSLCLWSSSHMARWIIDLKKHSLIVNIFLRWRSLHHSSEADHDQYCCCLVGTFGQKHAAGSGVWGAGVGPKCKGCECVYSVQEQGDNGWHTHWGLEGWGLYLLASSPSQ